MKHKTRTPLNPLRSNANPGESFFVDIRAKLRAHVKAVSTGITVSSIVVSAEGVRIKVRNLRPRFES